MKPFFRSHYRAIGAALAVSFITALALAGRLGPIQPVESLSPHKMVDMHCHTAGIGAGGSGCFISPKMEQSYKFTHYLKSFGVTRAELDAKGDAVILDRISERLAQSHHVGQAVILALDGAVDDQGELDRARTEVYVPNEYLATEVAKRPNLLFGASVNPYRRDALTRLEWAKAHGAVLIKWLPAIQQIDPADPRLIPFYKKLVELRLPLLSHTGNEHSFTHSADEYCDPDRLRLPLQVGVTVIAAHVATGGSFAGERSIDRLAKLMVEFPNLYSDISSLTQLNKSGYLKEVITRPEFKHRLVYGTDYPLVNLPILVSAYYHPFRLSVRQMIGIMKIQNPWDRDVALKQALGFPSEVWTRFEDLLPPPAPRGETRANAS